MTLCLIGSEYLQFQIISSFLCIIIVDTFDVDPHSIQYEKCLVAIIFTTKILVPDWIIQPAHAQIGCLQRPGPAISQRQDCKMCTVSHANFLRVTRYILAVVARRNDNYVKYNKKYSVQYAFEFLSNLLSV